MSKYVKELMIDQFREELGGLEEAFVVSLGPIDANTNSTLRATLRQKNITLRVVKNSLARLATRDTALEPAFANVEGSTAVVYGSTDIVALAKEILAIQKDKKFEKFFVPKGGAVGGTAIAADEIEAVSKWPSREEVLSTISGQILGVGMTLNGQLLGTGKTLASQFISVGGALASQIAQKAQGAEGEAA